MTANSLMSRRDVVVTFGCAQYSPPVQDRLLVALAVLGVVGRPVPELGLGKRWRQNEIEATLQQIVQAWLKKD